MRRVLLLAGVAGLGVVVVLVAGALFVVRGFFFVSGPCTEEERKVYAESMRAPSSHSHLKSLYRLHHSRPR
jgi:hypothetical protein